MNNKYLGEENVIIENSPFKNYSKVDWAQFWIAHYGQYDGAHHKAHTLDEVMQILYGTPVIVKLAKWSNGQEEYRFSLGEKTVAYLDFINEYEQDGYEWDTGIPA